MVYYIIHKCYNNYTFGALFAHFNLKILLKTFVHVQFYYDVKLFIPWFGELYDTHCELTSTLLSMMIASLASVIQLSFTYPHVPDEAQMNNHQVLCLVSIGLIFVFLRISVLF